MKLNPKVTVTAIQPAVVHMENPNAAHDIWKLTVPQAFGLAEDLRKAAELAQLENDHAALGKPFPVKEYYPPQRKLTLLQRFLNAYDGGH